MKKWIALLLAAVMVCGLFSGCGSDGEKAYVPTGDAILLEGQDPEDIIRDEEEIQELTLAYYPDRSMNPLIGNNYVNRVLFSLIYQGLFSVDSKNNTHPILCSNYQVSSDNMVYTYYVDPEATFSDGTRVTIEDVFATYEAARAGGYYKGRFTHVNSIDLDPSGGITFTLNTPYANFSILLDVPIVKASEVEAEHPVGSGPYKFSKSLSGAHLSKVNSWWCDVKLPTNAESIALIEATSQGQLRDEFEFGDLGLSIANPMFDSFENYRCDYELWNVENGVFLYLGVNVGYSEYFETDVLRKALTYAIDRETLIEENYRGMAQPATLACSPGSPYYSQSLAEKYGYDAMKFIDLIAGFQIPKNEDGKEQRLRLLVNSDDSARLRTARDIADALTEMGIPCGTLEYGTAGGGTTFEQVLRAGTYDLYLGQTKLSVTMDLSEFFRPYGNLSFGGITDNTIYQKCRDALANSGNYYNLHELVANDGKIIPVAFGSYSVFAERGLLTKLSPSRDNTFFYKLERTMSSVKIDTVYE